MCVTSTVTVPMIFLKNLDYIPPVDVTRTFILILKALDKVLHYGLILKLNT